VSLVQLLSRLHSLLSASRSGVGDCRLITAVPNRHSPRSNLSHSLRLEFRDRRFECRLLDSSPVSSLSSLPLDQGLEAAD